MAIPFLLGGGLYFCPGVHYIIKNIVKSTCKSEHINGKQTSNFVWKGGDIFGFFSLPFY